MLYGVCEGYVLAFSNHGSVTPSSSPATTGRQDAHYHHRTTPFAECKSVQPFSEIYCWK